MEIVCQSVLYVLLKKEKSIYYGCPVITGITINNY